MQKWQLAGWMNFFLIPPFSKDHFPRKGALIYMTSAIHRYLAFFFISFPHFHPQGISYLSSNLGYSLTSPPACVPTSYKEYPLTLDFETRHALHLKRLKPTTTRSTSQRSMPAKRGGQDIPKGRSPREAPPIPATGLAWLGSDTSTL